MRLNGSPVRLDRPRTATRRGIGLAPEACKQQGRMMPGGKAAS